MTAGTVAVRRRIVPQDALARYGIWVALVLLLVVAAIVAPDFYNINILRRTGQDAAILGIVTAGQALVMFVGGVDLSVAGLTVLAATVTADPRVTGSESFLVAVVVLVAVAVAVGLANSYLVIARRVQPFVATFGMLITLEGLRLVYTKASMSGAAWKGLVGFARARVLGIPTLVLVWALVLVVSAVVVGLTSPGRRFLLAGSNERAAFLSGIRVTRAKVVAYCSCSVLAVLAGLLLAGRTGYVDNYTGQGTELDSITAALVGGMTFAGGEGSLLSAGAAALFLACLYKLLIVLQWQPELQSVVQGAVLLLALALRGFTSRRSTATG